MLNINLTPEEHAQCEAFWSEIDPLLIDAKALELLNEFVAWREEVDTLNKKMKEHQKLLLFYRREFTEVEDSCRINEKGLILRKVNSQAIDMELFNRQVGLSSFLREVSQKILSLRVNEPKDLLSLLSFFNDDEKKEKIAQWKEMNILQVDTKYDLTVK